MADKKTTTSKKTAAQKAKASPKKPAKKSDGPIAPRDGEGLTMKQLHDLYHVLVTDLNFDRSRGQFAKSRAYAFHRAVGDEKDAVTDDGKKTARAALNNLICNLLSVAQGSLALSEDQYKAFENLLVNDSSFAAIGPYSKTDVGREHVGPQIEGW